MLEVEERVSHQYRPLLFRSKILEELLWDSRSGRYNGWTYH